jgi:hypothetical protein
MIVKLRVAIWFSFIVMHITNKQHNCATTSTPLFWLVVACLRPFSSAARNTNLFDSPSIQCDGWLLCCLPPRSAAARQSITIEHVDVLPSPPLSPHHLFQCSSLNVLRPYTSWLLCYWGAAGAAAIASTSMHIICAQSPRRCTSLCRAIGPFQWFWWLNRPPLEDHRQR